MGFVWRRLRRDRKADAETRNLSEEATDRVIVRLDAEIERLDRKVTELEKKAREERIECDRRIALMEGRIRQLQQQRQTSAGRLSRGAVDGSLRKAFPVPSELDLDPDSDLIRKLDELPARRGGAKMKGGGQ